jgi:DNA-binding response OmpR family regulator
MKKLLIIDDDPFLRQQISDLLRLNDYQVSAVGNAEKGLLALKQEAPDLIILDLGLPDIDGTTFARIVRTQSRVPILMLTARSNASDKVLGFEIGADDYLTKPFEPSELVARVRAILRRSAPYNESTTKQKLIEFGNLAVDTETRKVSIANRKLNLTSREYELFEYLAKNKDRALSREQIFEQVWGYDIEFSSNTLDVMVYRLRTKIMEFGGPEIIQTLRGFGYSVSMPAPV